ncbi:MAG TPA: HAMP domain-containing sensor histidine kinase [Phycisphaerae bacterium]|nr:HAMP domain-containing sensor histidine kinase [Phycisphaerae bacterium]
MTQDDRAVPPAEIVNADLDVQQQLAGLERQFADLREQVTQLQRLASLGTLSAILAHEFNNMLAPVVSYSQYALQRDDPQLARTALEKTLAAAQRLAELCPKILSMATDAASSPLIPQSLNPLIPSPYNPLIPVINDAVSCLARDLAKDDITLTVNVPPETQACFHAPTLRQVLFNLLLNARQAMLGRPGRLSISAQRAGDTVELTVADTGPGIKPADLDKIFEPFFSTKRHEAELDRGGVGLGLFVCKQLMTDLGGTISVASRPGQGATFTLTLPVS